MKPFHRIRPTEIPDNVFRLLDKDWMLVTAGKPGDFNTMTASWGHMGILWSLPVAIAYIRPQRYTRGFADRYPEYTLSFFTERYRSVLQFCGSRSGRDCDKVAETGLTVMETERGNVIFEEARLVARKNYPKDDFHRFYMGEIVNVLVRQGIPNLSFV
jgi:flavin reductase (DIM6/NTAB) family NADH-FMN oxidoreductase RutF